MRAPSLALSFVFVAAACDAELALSVQVAPIINGTSAPTLVALSAGEQLAIGFLADGAGNPFCTGTVIRGDAWRRRSAGARPGQGW
ncbi:MAG: hypothetical protein IT385_25020 [Deltaproteobacteria bacterium]|nr:hypothetical protein [Deltaproteobacteria bacterium]